MEAVKTGRNKIILFSEEMKIKNKKKKKHILTRKAAPKKSNKSRYN